MKSTGSTRNSGSPTTRAWSSLRPLLSLFAISVLGLVALRAAAPLAGTVIGNAASATYTDNANVPRQVTSNVVTTVVLPVYSLTLVADRTLTVSPGGQVAFPHILTNTGNASDTYTLAATNDSTGDQFDLTNFKVYADLNKDGVPDDTSSPLNLNTFTVTLAPGEQYGYVIVGTAPGTQASNDAAKVTTTATSTGGATPQTNHDTVTVTANAVISVTKSISSSSGPAPSTSDITYTLTYTNTGNTAATGVIIKDTIPTGMTYQTGTGRWSGSGTALTDAAAGDPTGITYDYNITTTNAITGVIAVVNPGSSGTLTFNVRVAAGTAPGIIPNTAIVSYDPTGTGGTPPGTGPGSPQPTNTVPYTVTQTVSVAIGSNNPATNGETPANGATTGAIYTVASANPSNTVTFVNRVFNLGNGTDSFDITIPANTFPAGTTFVYYKSDGNTPLVDTNGNGTPDTGPVSATTGFYDVVVKAILPTTNSIATATPSTLTVQSTSYTDPTQFNTVIDKLTAIVALSVDLTNDTPAPGGTITGTGLNPYVSTNVIKTNATNPGVTTTFTLYGYNISTSLPDTYNISYGLTDTFVSGLPSGWTVVITNSSTPPPSTTASITSTGVVAPVSSQVFYAHVTPPANATPGTQPIYFRILSPTTGATDTIRDAVTVNPVRALTITPNNTGQTYPGGIVIYDHTLTNQGNVTEGNGTGSTVALGLSETQAANGWTSVVYYDANNNGVIDAGEQVITPTNFGTVTGGLAPGASIGLLVKVFAPPGAANLSSDVTTLTVTTTNGTNPGTAPATVASTDTTTVVLGDVTILKEQSTAFAGPYATTQLTRLPGAVIYYRLTVTNTGSANSTQVIVYDTVPAYTTAITAGGASAGQAATSVGSVTKDGTSGDYEFNVGSLTPGATASITFGVTINP